MRSVGGRCQRIARRAIGAVATLACVSAAVLIGTSVRCAAADKTLYWAALDVNATLDDDGRLHVSERQEMVFSGDWNGGYRTFRVASGQTLDVHSLARIDAAGREVPLIEGNLDRVDHFARDGLTYRWRSRRPSDPPFAQTHLTYVLTYTLGQILLPGDDDETFVLDHDCAFPDRDGVIEQVHVRFDLGSQWEALDEFPTSFSHERLENGESLIVHTRLRHLGPGVPAAVWMPMPLAARGVLFVIVLAGNFTLFGWFLARESRLGRFNALPTAGTIDQAWLEANVLCFLPEEVGAVWDNGVGAPEVAAIIARLVAEGQLQTEVKEDWLLFIPTHTLKMRRIPGGGSHGPRSYETALLQKLFFRRTNETDTAAIRAHYISSGFDPAACIRTGLEAALRGRPELNDTAALPPFWPIGVALVAAILLMLQGLVPQGDPSTAGWATLLAGGGLMFIAGVCAAVWCGSVGRHLWLSGLFVAVVAMMPTVALAALSFSHVLSPFLRPDTYYVLGAAIFALTTCASTLRFAATRNGPKRLLARQRFAAARRYFIAELSRPTPRLHDTWFPYVIALGLNGVATRWFRRFGGEAKRSTSGASHTWTSGSSSTSGGTSSGTWTGGAGQFGGAGAGGVWLAAVSAMASGVSKPSSSGSGGGGGGGGSSGGGGGGGW